MFKIKGKYNCAHVFAETADSECIGQITNLCNQEWLQGCKIAIMPDCHAGKGCVVGTTIRLKDRICPSLVGTDVGCGMLVISIPKQLRLNLPKIDEFITHNIPSGARNNNHILYRPYEFKIDDLKCYPYLKDAESLKKNVGSLGSGNHFIEIDRDDSGNHYLVIHSGSRLLGHQVSLFYQELAVKRCHRWKGLFKDVPDELCCLEGQDARDYLHDAGLCCDFASLNRKYIAKQILEFIVNDSGYDDGCLNVYIDEIQQHQFEFGLENASVDIRSDGFETIHNYIGNDNVLRKGAICALKNKKVIIPINMRDGSIIGIGKGNSNYNCSGPHGAGRLMSRGEAKECIGVDEFRKTMAGIYSTFVCQSTVDESPMAYKDIAEIVDNTAESVDILDIIKPVYNFKAH